MSTHPQTHEERYQVVVNDEEQYSIWPEGRELPLGWKTAGKTGVKADCLSYIEDVWTDMRPRSLREQMQSAAANEPGPVPTAAVDKPSASLVATLSEGRHPLRVVGAGGKDIEHFHAQLKAGHIRVRFTETQGGTELGLGFDPAVADLTADTGPVRLASTLSLDGVRAKCLVEIDPETLSGHGYLEPVPAR